MTITVHVEHTPFLPQMLHSVAGDFEVDLHLVAFLERANYLLPNTFYQFQSWFSNLPIQKIT